ncbi:uncharacterized protein G2W53_017606 [Senna tora]|uniref:Uncharacterized protein n=1 Tax=Senna tora TaxID=362788 RepID=A0A834TR71_9FABA|nr:uncharacterized protein G2W53_017606 [Senna tora]
MLHLSYDILVFLMNHICIGGDLRSQGNQRTPVVAKSFRTLPGLVVYIGVPEEAKVTVMDVLGVESYEIYKVIGERVLGQCTIGAASSASPPSCTSPVRWGHVTFILQSPTVAAGCSFGFQVVDGVIAVIPPKEDDVVNVDRCGDPADVLGKGDASASQVSQHIPPSTGSVPVDFALPSTVDFVIASVSSSIATYEPPVISDPPSPDAVVLEAAVAAD